MSRSKGPLKRIDFSWRGQKRNAFAVATLALGLSGFAAQGVTPAAQAIAKPTQAQIDFFEAKVRPVLIANCGSCHGGATPMGGLSTDSLAALLKGGKSGPAIVPGDSDKSLLVTAIRQTGALKMPQGGKLKPEEIADIGAWVKMGAPWPEAAKKEGDTLWSLQPVQHPTPPKVKDPQWVRNPIDSFVLAKLEANGQKPAPETDRRTLIRRVTYDLTGLPPTPDEVDAFLADKAPEAYGRLVDRLLASPHYGERWARRWLDVARYADTKGYVFNEDRNYPNAYTYRDWVIDAMNRDLPYNRFIVDQLAADRLPEAQNGVNRKDLAALGFLTVGRRFLNAQPDIMDDRIDVTMRGFEGLTVACARCHDHKFDPIPTQDYYSLYAVFASSEEETAPISPPAISDPWVSYNKKLVEDGTAFRDGALEQVRLLRKQESTPDGASKLDQKVKQALQSLGEGALPEGETQKTLMAAFEPEERQKLEALQKEVADLMQHAPTTPELAMAMKDRSDPSDGVVFKRGNPDVHGDVAPRRFLLALSKPGVEREHWTADSGRLELAEAIASKDNPLTARVIVNRMWQEHFGAGIVRTPSDFGHQGEKPTDPKLLDYLASWFMDNGWSLKKLHRLIVTSATYRESSDASQAMIDADPDNRDWGRMNRKRLDLEQVRDSLMDAGGRLDLSDVGGKSVDLWSQPFTQRRAVYGFIERQNLPGIFRTFDFATPDATSAKRFVTTVPQQALFFMNSPFCVDEARALASRPEVVSSKDDPQRVRRLYRLLFQRMPDKDELALGVAYLKSGFSREVASPSSVWSYGFGGFDASRQQTSSFTPLKYVGDHYQFSDAFPDPKLGYMLLNLVGGHPGHDGDHAVIRRWIAPATMTITVDGTLSHGQAQGDGVRARIISNRNGLLGEWQAHNTKAATHVASFAVQKGDLIDFMVDPIASDAYDAFGWAPVIHSADGQTWDATANFGGPPPPPLTRLALYAQALMMTNEFIFIR